MHSVLKLRPGKWTVVVPLCSGSAGGEISLVMSLSHDTNTHRVCLNGEEERERWGAGQADQAVEAVSRNLFHAIQGNRIAGAL